MTQRVVYRVDEVLSHFRCPVCQGGWTVVDFDDVERLTPGEVTCPHCRAALESPGDVLYGSPVGAVHAAVAATAPILGAESLEGVHYAPGALQAALDAHAGWEAA